MKHLILLAALLATAITTSAQTPTAASPSSAKPAADPTGRFTINWKPNPPWELTSLQKQLDLMERAASIGKIEREHVSSLAARIAHLERTTPPLLSINSKGGPLGAFASAASRMNEFSLTLLNAADPADLDTPIPAFELRNAHWGTVINVLGTFLGPHGLDLRLVGGDSINPAESRSVVCMLTRLPAVPSERHRTAQSDFESLPLDEHIHGAQTIDVIVDAIRTAWTLDPARDPAVLRLKFHPPTKLLLVSGPAPAGHIARSVISGLQKNTAHR